MKGRRPKFEVMTVISYLIITVLVMSSGVLVTFGMFRLLPYLLFLFCGVIFITRKSVLSLPEIFFFLCYFTLLLLQALKFSQPVTSIVLPSVTMFSAILSARVVRKTFVDVFVKVILFFCIASIPFWIVDLFPFGHDALLRLADVLPQGGTDLIKEVEDSSANAYDLKSLWLYSVSDAVNLKDEFSLNIPRNCGPFWEPGRFTFFISLALMLNIFVNNAPIFSHTTLLLLFTDLTTFSTSGYLVLSLILLGYIINSNIRSSRKAILYFLLLVWCFASENLPFMSDKVFNALQETNVVNSRFGAMFYHFTQIAKSPFVGFGVYLEKVLGDVQMAPCGITDLLRMVGIPFSIIFFVVLFKSFRKLFGVESPTICVVLSYVGVLFLCYTQTIMMSPFFLLFYCFGLMPAWTSKKKQYKTVVYLDPDSQ